MKLETVTVQVEQDRATLTLSRPERRNSISVQMVNDLRKALHHVEDNTAVRIVLLRGEGTDFCTGIDLGDFASEGAPDIHGFNRWEKVCRTLERLPALTIAMVHGECAGGGLQLALACDIRVGSSDSIYHFHDVRMGIIPGMGTYRLPKFIGLGRARRMALTGRKVHADEAERIGLIDHLCSPENLEGKTEEAIAEFGPINPNAVELIRRLLDESYENQWEDFLGNFLAAQSRAIRSEEFRSYIEQAHKKGTPRGDEA